MRLYEGMFLMDNRQANRDWDGSLAALTGMITKHGAEIVRVTKWGERRLAYEINGRRRGTYVLIYFNADGEAANRVYHECELSELIHRALILKVDQLPAEEPRADKRETRLVHTPPPHQEAAAETGDGEDKSADEKGPVEDHEKEPPEEKAAPETASESA